MFVRVHKRVLVNKLMYYIEKKRVSMFDEYSILFTNVEYWFVIFLSFPFKLIHLLYYVQVQILLDLGTYIY